MGFSARTGLNLEGCELIPRETVRIHDRSIVQVQPGPIFGRMGFSARTTPPPSETYVLQPTAFAGPQAPAGLLDLFQKPRVIL